MLTCFYFNVTLDPNHMKTQKHIPHGLFTTQEAIKKGLNKKALIRLLESDEITRVARGVYCHAEQDLAEKDQAVLATLLVGTPSALCLLSALAYHHLTDVIPKHTWIMVPAEKRTKHAALRVYRTANPQWRIGIHKKNGYWVTDLERTLVDCLVHRRLLGTQTAVEALRQAIVTRKTTLDKVLRMATRLQVEHRILMYIEALA